MLVSKYLLGFPTILNFIALIAPPCPSEIKHIPKGIISFCSRRNLYSTFRLIMVEQLVTS